MFRAVGVQARVRRQVTQLHYGTETATAASLAIVDEVDVEELRVT